MEPNIADSVAAIVRAEMARRRRSSADLARELGISPVSVSRRLTGEVPIDVNELAQIAAFLGLPMSSLLPEAATA